jgi:anti-anti-sigma factor
MSAAQPTVEALQRQVAALQSRVAELEQHEQSLQVFKQTVDKAPDGVVVTNLTGQITYANAAWVSMSAYADGGLGKTLSEIVAEDERDKLPTAIQQVMTQGFWRGEWNYLRADGETFPVQISAFVIRDNQSQPQAITALVRDLSEQRQAEEERLALQEQVIDAQRAALREVSTPLIPLADDVVVMPLVGAIDSARAQQIMEVLLEGIAQYQADTVLLDISGVRVVDTQVADALLRAARAVQLLGAQIILTGISADVAQTIVHLGADMGRIMTRANLQEGLRYALEERAR